MLMVESLCMSFFYMIFKTPMNDGLEVEFDLSLYTDYLFVEDSSVF